MSAVVADRAPQARRQGRVRWVGTRLSQCLLGFAVLAFLLPFVSVSCSTPRGYGSVGGGVSAAYRGVTLALGGEPDLAPADRVPVAGASTAEDHVPPQPIATAALILTAAAFVVSLAARRHRALWAAGLATGAAIFTALAQLDFDRTWTARIVDKLQRVDPAALARSDPTRFVTPAIGFWALLLLLALGAVLSAILAATGRRPAATARASNAPVPVAA